MFARQARYCLLSGLTGVGASLRPFGPGDFCCCYYSIAGDYLGLAGLLETLVETRAFEPGQIIAALTALLLGTPENGIDDPEIRCVAGILERLKAADRGMTSQRLVWRLCAFQICLDAERINSMPALSKYNISDSFALCLDY